MKGVTYMFTKKQILENIDREIEQHEEERNQLLTNMKDQIHTYHDLKDITADNMDFIEDFMTLIDNIDATISRLTEYRIQAQLCIKDESD